MKVKAVVSSFVLSTLLASPVASSAQESAEQTAINQAVYREANRIQLRQKLNDAAAAEARHEVPLAAKIYGDAWDLVQKIGIENVQAEAQQVREGVFRTRMALAQAAQSRGDYNEADRQVKTVLNVNPGNPDAMAFKRKNDELLAESLGSKPDPETQAVIKDAATDHILVSTLLQDGKVLYEAGKLDQSEVKFRQALRKEPNNQAAWYYISLIQEAKFAQAQSFHQAANRQQLAQVEDAWSTPIRRDLLPVPNPYAKTNLVFTGSGRQAIYVKLDRIRLDTVKYVNLPLSEVVANLNDEAKKRDPEKRGLNFIINANVDPGAGAAGGATTVDPATGLPVAAAAPAESIDPGELQIKIDPALTDVRLEDVLRAIVMVSPRPLKYSVEDYAIVFSLKAHETPPLYTRTFKVDPNTFYQGLESVSAFVFGETDSSSGGGGGGGGGGRSSSSSSGQSVLGAIVSRVLPSPGGVSGGRSGGGGSSQSGGGLKFLTHTNSTSTVNLAAREFFEAVGVDLAPPKAVFFNDRKGELFVRASLADLDLIDSAIQVLNTLPPQVNVKARFIEVSQIDNKGLGFDWYLGNTLMNNKTIGAQGGTAPSMNGTPSPANPLGTFPGNVLGGTAIAPSSTDQLVTGGLRNPQNALFTLTGILTDPQFRVVIKAIEQRTGADELSSPEVTIISGRQAQMKATDVQTIIVDYDFSQAIGNVGGGTTTSDRNVKQDFVEVDPQEVLAKVATLPITEWSYKAEAGTRHIGPMAQDFRAAFNLGATDKQIAVVDANGIALTAIKALNEKNTKLEAQVKQTSAQLQAKDAELAAMKQRLEKLEAALSKLAK